MVAAVLVVGGAGGAWAWTEREERAAAEQAATRARAADAVEAQVRDVEALQAQAADVAAVHAATVRADARSALVVAAEHARATLATTQDAVADDAVRQALAAILADVDVTLAATDPAATDPATASDPSAVAGTTGARSATALRAVTAALVAADSAVVAAHEAWLQAEAASAAARAVTPAPSRPAPRPAAGGSAPSCDTTYTGPPFYTSPATAGGDGSNGRLPPESLSAISWDVDPRGTPYFLTNAAAAALERLNDAFRGQFGHDLDLDLTYRDYDTQVAMREALGSVAAKPGTSSHGTGLALDVPELPCEYGWDTPQRDWLVSNGPAYGWVSPSWAGKNGSNPEYWHFEFRG
ncbi:M15 family metallopeptidase [Cellulomonas xylanilytica]|uniref:D-alanyl-D-alanine carboxypeptidase-like core domain-containing protein n=1 Tax=Cellulomonas xylanilytica TaxID=233583 RepID=A0A510V6K0_9CELL|nr:M15 family metallopeptidase [Cellulomonas xylanilytica]GEK22482.1 hypothetical protein CXY01_30020 [Cellulomonas xylanilytica]